MIVGLLVGRRGRVLQSVRRGRAFVSLGTVCSRIRGMARVSRRPRYAAAYCVHNDRHDRLSCARS